MESNEAAPRAGEPVRRRVLLTGGGGSIGGATAALLAADGDQVIRVSHDARSRADVTVDFRDDAALADTVRSLPGTFDGIVLCHGILEKGTLSGLAPADWRRTLDVNLTSCFVILHALADRLHATRSIVIVSSTAGLDRSRNGGPHYTASKWALNGLVRHLAADLGPSGTRINAVCPGHITNDMTRRVNTPETIAAGIANIPLRRGGQPDEVARMIRFLLSDDASYVTGALIPVAGGTHR
jgi:NAD(P)-dependent dehydrogenase (short-subunit alcohol dehydrogenase family)